ncbi:uncharacterized protein LOC124943497 [Impatiens glandulifera]|uniref:uncharacterized protein LOC124943497 n=1 Tax=Impatiens glandulifera TaxID=253017 RepID=UPI001FB05EBB|nr:uncharacterized protein LOC124943497 [Impatiens glandulifera]
MSNKGLLIKKEGVDENQHNNKDEQVRPQEEIRVEEHFIAEEEGVDENQHNEEDRSEEEEIRENGEHGNDSETAKVDELSEYIDESDPVNDSGRFMVGMHFERKKSIKVAITDYACDYRSQRFVLEEIQGNNDKEFADLWRYTAELKKNNDTSTFILQTTKDESTGVNKFKRFYSCFEALKRGWLAGCRPIISFDRCFLKSKSKGELLTTIGRDANEHMFPIAWAVVEGENLSSWESFLKLLIEDLQLGEGSNLTIMSDMQKGLIKAVENLLHNAEHRFCCRNWYRNRARAGYMGGDLKILF